MQLKPMLMHRGPDLQKFTKPWDRMTKLAAKALEHSSTLYEEMKANPEATNLKFNFAAFGCPKKTLLNNSTFLTVHAAAVVACITTQHEIRRSPNSYEDMTFTEQRVHTANLPNSKQTVGDTTIVASVAGSLQRAEKVSVA